MTAPQDRDLSVPVSYTVAADDRSSHSEVVLIDGAPDFAGADDWQLRPRSMWSVHYYRPGGLWLPEFAEVECASVPDDGSVYVYHYVNTEAKSGGITWSCFSLTTNTPDARPRPVIPEHDPRIIPSQQPPGVPGSLPLWAWMIVADQGRRLNAS